MNLRPASGLLTIFFILPLVSSCAATMSLEEAKKVTVATSEKSFVPPPRKAADVYALLDRKEAYISKSTAEYTRKAAMTVPTEADETTLKVFYEERGLAALQLGRYKEAPEDLRKAYDLLLKVKGRRNLLAMNLRARALNKSMTGLIDDTTLTDQTSGRVVASYAHPLFWAPFVMAGDPGK